MGAFGSSEVGSDSAPFLGERLKESFQNRFVPAQSSRTCARCFLGFEALLEVGFDALNIDVFPYLLSIRGLASPISCKCLRNERPWTLMDVGDRNLPSIR
jgi:hypothetical protein